MKEKNHSATPNGVPGADVAESDGQKRELAARIRACADIAGSGDALSRKSGVPRRTLENYLSGHSEPKALVVLKIADAAGVTLDWLIAGRFPKRRSDSGDEPVSNRVVRDRAEAIYEGILIDISVFLDRKGWNMTLRRQHQLAEEFLEYVIRYDEADTRAAVLEVLVETRIPVVYEEQTAHEKIGPPSGKPGSEPSK